MENERSGFLTGIAVLYTLGTGSQLLNFLGSILQTVLVLVVSPITGLAFLALDVLVGVIVTINVIYLFKLWTAHQSLKRWTDLVHLISVVVAVLMLVAFALVPVMSSGFGEIGQLGYAFVLGFFGLALLVEIAFWVGIRSHLARLEREGRASFDRGMFNRSPVNAPRV